MIFKSRQVNLDPEPWESVNHGKRGETALVYDDMRYRPRPEFEPTRDPEPWMCHDLPNHGPFETPTCDRCYWAPRREQFDTPVNRVLVAFRDDVTHNPYTAGFKTQVEVWLIGIDFGLGQRDGATPDEIDHARRVLTRLANWQVTS